MLVVNIITKVTTPVRVVTQYYSVVGYYYILLMLRIYDFIARVFSLLGRMIRWLTGMANSSLAKEH
jgi:hypothetical protein